MGLFEKYRQGPANRDELIAGGASEAYADWLLSSPEPGEVFVDTGEPSAADTRKLDTHFSESGWALLRLATHATVQAALEVDLAHVNALQDGVDETLRSVGVDPRTLLPLESAT